VRHAVTRKQPNSAMCFVCGLKNPASLRTAFYDLDNGGIAALFTARDEHQGYPGRLHGGIATALLDETMGRAIMSSKGAMLFAVTVELATKFMKPIPLGVGLRVVGRVVGEDERSYEATGELLLPTGEVAATGAGKYVKLPIERIAGAELGDEQWAVSALPDDPLEIEVGGV